MRRGRSARPCSAHTVHYPAVGSRRATVETAQRPRASQAAKHAVPSYKTVKPVYRNRQRLVLVCRVTEPQQENSTIGPSVMWRGWKTQPSADEMQLKDLSIMRQWALNGKAAGTRFLPSKCSTITTC